MTSKIIVNNIEADTGISTITFNNDISSNTVRGNIISDGTSTFDVISGVSTIGVTTAHVTSINNLSYPTAGALSNRNRIINGSMVVAQWGTSSTANGYVALDRWYVNQSGGSTTFSQETFTVGEERSGLQNYAKLAVSTSSDYTNISQRIENVKSIPSGSVTVSFDAKGTAPTGNLTVSLVQNFGSGGSSDVDITPQTVTLTSSWQRFNLTFTVPSITGKTVGSDNFLQIAIGQYSNTSTTAWELNITGVQLEVGSKSTPFEHRSYGDELARCQRYYQKVINSAGGTARTFVMGAYVVTRAFGGYPLSTPMRSDPDVTFSGLKLERLNLSASYTVTDANTYQTMIGSNAQSMEFNVASGLTGNEAYYVAFDSGGYLAFDSEL